MLKRLRLEHHDACMMPDAIRDSVGHCQRCSTAVPSIPAGLKIILLQFLSNQGNVLTCPASCDRCLGSLCLSGAQ